MTAPYYMVTHTRERVGHMSWHARFMLCWTPRFRESTAMGNNRLKTRPRQFHIGNIIKTSLRARAAALPAPPPRRATALATQVSRPCCFAGRSGRGTAPLVPFGGAGYATTGHRPLRLAHVNTSGVVYPQPFWLKIIPRQQMDFQTICLTPASTGGSPTPTPMSVVQDGTKADSLGARQHTWDNPPMPDWATTFPPQEARVRMCLDDIVTYKHPAVGARTANKVLKQMRARNTWLEDLSESPLLNWRSFLASRSDAARIIGAGVVQFLFFRIPGSVDANWSGVPRGDFAVMRWDRSVVRMHPASTGEQPHLIFGKPGRGLLDWVQPPTSADSCLPRSPAEPVQPRPVPQLKVAMTREAVLSVTKVDCISRRRASEMLDMCSTIMARHAISTLDLTAGTTFAWWRWLANLEDQALDMLFADHGIHSFWARRVDQQACYVALRADGVAFSLEISKGGTGITELPVRESSLYHKHGATNSNSKTEEGEPAGDSSGGLAEPTADPIGSSSARQSSPPAPADHSCHSTCADNVHARPATPREWLSEAAGDLLGGGPRNNTRTLPADSCGVGSHGVDSPMDPSEPPMGSMDQPSTAPDASASQPSGVASAGQLPDPPRSGRFKVPAPPPPPTPEEFDAWHASAPPAPAQPWHAEQPPAHLPPVKVALQVPALVHPQLPSVLGQPQLLPAQPQPPLAQPHHPHAELPPVPQAWRVQSLAPEQPWGTGEHAWQPPLSQANAPPMCQENTIGAQLLPWRNRPEHASQPHVAPQRAEFHARHPAERPSQPPLGPPNQTQQQPLALEEQPVVHRLPTHMVPGGPIQAVG